MKLLLILTIISSFLLASFEARAEASIKIGLEWNDNVSTQSTDNFSGISDVATVLDFTYEKELFDRENPLVFSYSYSQSIYDDLTDFNLRSHSIFFSRDFNILDKSINILYGFSDTRLAGSKFLNLHTITPTLGLELSSDMYMSSYYNYMNKKFFTDSGRDSQTNAIGFNLFLFDDKGFYLIGYKFENEDTKNEQYDYDANQLNFSRHHELSTQSKIIMGLKYYDKDYLKTTISISEKRRDRNKSLYFTNEYMITDTAVSEFTYEYTDSKSNLTSSNYTENTISFGLINRF